MKKIILGFMVLSILFGVNSMVFADMVQSDEEIAGSSIVYADITESDGKTEELVRVQAYDYSLSKYYYTDLNDEMCLYYSVYDPALYNNNFTVSVKVMTYEGDTVVEYGYVTPEFKSDYTEYTYFCVAFPMPEVQQNGAYVLHTEIHYDDGMSYALESKQIYIGSYEIVDHITSLTHDQITPKTTQIGVHIYFGNFVQNPDEFSVSLLNSSGDVIGSSEQWYYYLNSSAMSESMTSLVFIIDIDEPIICSNNYDENVYEIRLNYNGSREVVGNTSFTIYCDQGIQVLSAKATGSGKYLLYTEGLSAGTYPTYAGEWDDEPNGVLTVNSDGSAELSIDSENINDISFYVDVEQNKCEYISFWAENPAELPPDVPRLGSVMPGFLKSGEASIENMKFSIFNKYIVNADDIQKVQLVSAGNIVAEGENLRFSTYSNNNYYIGNLNIDYFYAYYLVDFPSIRTEDIENDSLTLRVVLDDGEVSYDIPVLDDNEGDVKAEITLTNAVNADGGSLSVSPYTHANYMVGNGDIGFKISGTNKTDGSVILQKFNETECIYEDVTEIPLTELDRTEDNGYTYTGSFANEAESGGFYRIRFGSACSVMFRASDFKYYLNYYNKMYDLSKDLQGIWIYGFNIDFNEGEFTALFNDEQNGTVNIPIQVRNNYENRAYFVFDFSSVEAFDTVDLHLCYNGIDIDTMKINDCRETQKVIYSYTSYYNDKESIYMYGSNIDKMNLQLKLWKIEDYMGYGVLSEYPVKEVSLNIPSSDSTGYYLDISSIGVSEGLYVYAVFSDGKPVSYDSTLYIPDSGNSEKYAVLNKKQVSGADVVIDIENVSEEHIENAVLAVCAYDKNGELLDVTIQNINIAAHSSTGDIYADTAANAEQYKVFLWDGLRSMKPLMAEG